MHNNNQYGTRTQWWQAVFGTLEQSGGNGSAFWWFPDRNNDPNFGVSESNPEMAVFKQHCQRMKAKCKPYVSSVSPNSRCATPIAPSIYRTMLLLSGKKTFSGDAVLFSITGARIQKQSGTGVVIVERRKGRVRR
jgi:hypothetical protein